MVYFGGFFAKVGHFAGFSLHIINVAVKISEAATYGVHYIFFRVLRSSFRVRHSSVGCSITQKEAA